MKLSEDRQSTSIYLEQIENHISVGEGYSRIRLLLFKELHMLDGNNPSIDDKLAESIVIKLANSLTNSLNFHQSEKVFRTLQIITDLLTYAEDIMTPAMHTDLFMTSLTEVAKPRLVTFNSSLDSTCRNTALQIIAFWFEKYAREENSSYELFIQAYKYLRGDKKVTFPTTINIKPVDTYKLQSKNSKNQTTNTPPDNATKVILQDIEQFTIKTQKALQQAIKSIATTEYVRLIKHKSKVLFEFTQKGSDLTNEQKSKVKDLYKRLRTVLKEVDKYNQSKIETKVSISQEQEYVEQKITPKKKEKCVESPQSKKIQEKKQQIQKTNEVDLLERFQIGSQVKKINEKEKGEAQKKSNVQINLLDIDFEPNNKPLTPPKKVTTNLFPFTDLLGENLPNLPLQQSAQPPQEEEFVEGILVGNVESQPVLQDKSMKELQEVFSTPSKKNVSAEEESDHLAKHESNNSRGQSPGFDNEEKKDKYSQLNEINLSPTSSNEQNQLEEKKEGLGLKYNLFGIFGNKDKVVKGERGLFDEHVTYDDVPAVLQNILQEQVKPKLNINLDLLSGEPQEIISSKLVKAVDYSKYAVQMSPHEEKDEDHALEMNKPFQGLQQVEIESPKKNNAKGEFLKQNGDG